MSEGLIERRQPSVPGTFGGRLRAHRLAAGFSQEELAERAGLSVRGLSDLERGARRAPHVSTVRRLSDALRLGEEDRANLLAAGRGPSAQPSSVDWAPHPSPEPPSVLTSFVGRERQLAEIQELLGSSRILTLTGTGGVGKTRLALELARRVTITYADGVCWVELAPLTDPHLVVRAVASRLSVPEQSGWPLRQTLQAAIGDRQLLLVLDNCEHVLSACAELVDSLAGACPALTVVATSREPFRIAGETVWVVPPLVRPEPTHNSVETVASTEAVRLFVERARAGSPSFTLRADDVAAIAEICTRLEGLPLAIELAAARVRFLTVQQIAQHLDHCLRVLTTGARLAPHRHQTLRAALDWSYELLTEPEQRVFQRLGVFAGGWTLNAAEVVCSEDGLGADETFDVMASLVDKSLVIGAERENAMRYRLLEPVRQYARERLAFSGGMALRRHADFYLTLAEEAAVDYHGPREQRAFARIACEQDNLRAALRGMIVGGEADLAHRMAGALFWFWMQRRDLAEARGWLESVSALMPSDQTSESADALYMLGCVAWLQGDYTASQDVIDRSMSVARLVDDERIVGRALAVAAELAAIRGEHTSARLLAEDSLAVSSRQDDRWNTGRCLDVLAKLALREGDQTSARGFLERAAGLSRESGDVWSLSMALMGLGDLARTHVDYEQAARLYDESLVLQQATGHVGHAMSLMHNLGYVALGRGKTQRARELFQESLAQYRNVGEQRGVAECLVGLAGTAVADRDPTGAVRLFGAAEALFERLGTQLSPSNRNDYERLLAEAKAALDARTFARAWADGRGLDWEDAISSVAAG